MNISQEVLLWFGGAAVALVNLFIGYVLAGIRENMKNLAAADEKLANKVDLHREDVMKNYVTSNDMQQMRTDILERLDRFEKTMLSIAGRRNTDKD